MRALSLLARVGLALLSLQFLAGFEEISRKNVLTLTQEWSELDGKQNWPQLNLSTVLFNGNKVCVRVRFRMEPLGVKETLRIEFSDSAATDASNSSIVISNHESSIPQWRWLSKGRSRKVEVSYSSSLGRGSPNVQRRPVWELQFDCFKSKAGQVVYVSVHYFNHTLCSAPYLVQHKPAAHCKYSIDPVPNYNATVDALAKLFMVNMDRGQNVNARLCYQNWDCNGIAGAQTFQNTDLHPVVNLSFPHLVPCVCLQVYCSGDARRLTTCPFKGKALPGDGDILSSSTLKPAGSSGYKWQPICLFDPPQPTVSLCWKHQKKSHCFPVQNSTLQDRNLIFNMTDVDRHTNMCMKFSLNDSHRVFCPFTSDLLKWEVVVVPGSQRLHVYFSSQIRASFAAQLCVEELGECVVKGNIYSVQMEEGTTEVELRVPLPFFRPGLCVQVWRLVPALRGRRIICPDYTNRKWGLVVSGLLFILVILVTMGLFTYILIKKKTSVWRHAERKPVLLVCSSDDAEHVAAVCALATGLQEELHIDVRFAQWALCSTQASLAQLGPAPWLYGQWQEVQQAGGMVLLAWSLEAQQTFIRWGEMEGKEPREGNVWKGKADVKLKDKDWAKTQLGKQKEKDKEDWMTRAKETTSITAPVFNASLTCLWAGLNCKNCGQGFGLVCFGGLSGSCHIPKDLRLIRRFCLPRDLSNLIHELDLRESSPAGGVKEVSSSWCCWPRLFSKALSVWLSQRLAQRLEAWLPQIDSEKCKVTSQHILKLPWRPYSGQKLKKMKEKDIALLRCKSTKENKEDNVVSANKQLSASG